MKKLKSKYSAQEGRSDMPVIVVATVAAVMVLILVTVFLVILPNRQMKAQLTERNHRLELALAERRMIAEHQPVYDQELKHIRDEAGRLEDKLVRKAESLKEPFSKAFAPQHFEMESFVVGPERPTDSPWWKIYPFEFSVEGSREDLLAAVELWRKAVPESMRLIEVDMKKQGDGKKFLVNFQCNLAVVIPIDQLPPSTLQVYTPEGLPEPRFYETATVRALRTEYASKEKELQALSKWAEETAVYRRDKVRLEEMQVKRADFTGQREREMDSFESQLRGIFSKADVSDAYRILVKVQETLVDRRKSGS